MKFSHILIAALLISAGFLAGSSWKSEKADSQANLENAKEEPGSRAIAPVRIISNNEEATIQLFEEAAPSVVFITSIALQRDYWMRNVFEVPRGTGSGFIWDEKGHIVTNYHVIMEGQRLRVTLSDQSTWDASIVGTAPEKDLAVLKIDAPADVLKPIAVGSSGDLRVGQFVYAIGNPFGLDQTLTTGIISAVGREIESVARVPIRDVIQTDAAINPGNSGGPLLDSSGRLIGVNTQIYSPSGASAGIGFSIPVDAVNWVVPDLIAHGKIKRPVLGVQLVPGTTTRRLKMKGALVFNVIDGGAAQKAGLRATRRDRNGDLEWGDLIVAINERAVTSNDDLILELEKYEAEDEITVTIERDDGEMDLNIVLDAPK